MWVWNMYLDTPSKIVDYNNFPFNFFPVRESPLTAQAGQLRGIPRKIRDSAADLFNAVQQWNKLHIEGMDIIQQIKNKKLDQM